MTASPPPLNAVLVRIIAPLVVVLALAGCAGTTTGSASTPTPKVSASSGPCDEVTVVVDFGTLDAPSIHACTRAGVAADALKSAHITTVGTADYGDAVICRVDDLPAPDVESCAKLPSAAYWALWVKASPDAAWDYAQEGAATLKLTAGQSLGLVYTQGSDSTPPKD